MSISFRKRFSLGKLLNFNLSKSGVGVSVGPRGAKLGISANGDPYASLSKFGFTKRWGKNQIKEFFGGAKPTLTDKQEYVCQRMTEAFGDRCEDIVRSCDKQEQDILIDLCTRQIVEKTQDWEWAIEEN